MADAAAYAPHNVHNGGQLPPPMGGHGSPAQWHRMCGRLPLYPRRGSQRPQWRVVGPGSLPGSGGALHDTHDGGQPQPGFIPGCRGPGLARTCEPLSRSCSGRLHDGGSHPARWPTMADPARRAPYNVHNGGQLPPPMGGHGSPAQWHRMYGRLPLYLRGGSQRLQWEVIGTGFGPEVAAHCTIPTMAGSPGLGFYPRLPGPGLGPDVRASPKVLLHTIPTMAGSCRLQWEVTAARHNGTGCVDTERYTSLRGSPRPQL